jgi:protein-tyrosine phosphatase
MAEVVIRNELADSGLADRVSVQSAGTGDWHLGERMHYGALAELRRRGYDGSTHRARQIGPDWLDRFDLLIATDQANLRSLRRMAASRQRWSGGDEPPGSPPQGVEDRIWLLRSFDPRAPEGAEVPDPYGAGPREFAEVFDMIQAAARGLVAELAKVLADAGG